MQTAPPPQPQAVVVQPAPAGNRRRASLLLRPASLCWASVLSQRLVMQSFSAGTGGLLPSVEELVPAPRPEEAFMRLADRPHCLFLDSAWASNAGPILVCGRRSVRFHPISRRRQRCLASDGRPATAVRRNIGGETAAVSGRRCRFVRLRSRPELRAQCRVRRPTRFCVPALALGFYNVVLAFDHLSDRAWIISQGFPEVEPSRRRRRAAQRLAQVRNWIAKPAARAAGVARHSDTTVACPSPQHSVPGVPGVTSNFSKDGYLASGPAGRSATSTPATCSR